MFSVFNKFIAYQDNNNYEYVFEGVSDTTPTPSPTWYSKPVGSLGPFLFQR